MSTATTTPVLSISKTELEELIRRVVREDLTRLLSPAAVNPVDDWSHEGPDDPEGDEILAREALAQLEEYRKHPERAIKWEDLKAELLQAETADELSD